MISVLMPIYNGIEFIEQSIDSIKNQTYKNWELIVGINGHPENSDIYKISCKYQNDKIRVLDLFNYKGKSETLNQMIKHCNYNYIALLDVDDIWLPNKLELQVPFLDKYDIIGTKCIYFGDRNNIPNIALGDLKDFNFFRFNPIINSSCIIKKELCYWNNIILEDYDLWLRLWKNGKIL